jgi:Domain of unknown function (DUF4386)
MTAQRNIPLPDALKESVLANSSKRLARVAGLVYLLVAIFGGFALGFVYPKIYVAGDAVKTTANLIEHATLIRIAIAADLFQATLWVVVAMLLSRLLNRVHMGAASAMVVFAAIGASITCLNAVFEFEAVRVATGDVDLSAVGKAGSNALALLLVDTQHYGVFAAGIFFGLWLAPMGYLAYSSGLFPRGLGILLIVGCGCYLMDTFTALLTPGLAGHLHSFITIPAAIAELWMVSYLLVIGVRTAPDTKFGLPVTATV